MKRLSFRPIAGPWCYLRFCRCLVICLFPASKWEKQSYFIGSELPNGWWKKLLQDMVPSHPIALRQSIDLGPPRSNIGPF